MGNSKKKSWIVSFRYKIPINFNIEVEAETEKEAILLADAQGCQDGNGEFEEPMYVDEAPDYKLNRRNYHNSVGVDAWLRPERE